MKNLRGGHIRPGGVKCVPGFPPWGRKRGRGGQGRVGGGGGGGAGQGGGAHGALVGRAGQERVDHG